jgi:hypothetical protein
MQDASAGISSLQSCLEAHKHAVLYDFNQQRSIRACACSGISQPTPVLPFTQMSPQSRGNAVEKCHQDASRDQQRGHHAVCCKATVSLQKTGIGVYGSSCQLLKYLTIP